MATAKKSELHRRRDIQVLEGLEPVRKRPGDVHRRHRQPRLPPPALGDRRQLGRRGHQRPRHRDRGHAPQGRQDGHRRPTTAAASPSTCMPKYKKPALEVILTTLHAGGKFEQGNYMHSGGLHGVGSLGGQRALAKLDRAGPARRQARTCRRSRAARPPRKLKAAGPARGTGTAITFTPDPEIFGEKLQFDAELIRERLEAKSYLHKGMTVVFRDETATPATEETFDHDGGIADYLDQGRRRARQAAGARRAAPVLRCATRTASGWRSRWPGPRPPTSTSARTSTASPPRNGGTHEAGLRAGRRQGGAQLHRDARAHAQGRRRSPRRTSARA